MVQDNINVDTKTFKLVQYPHGLIIGAHHTTIVIHPIVHHVTSSKIAHMDTY